MTPKMENFHNLAESVIGKFELRKMEGSFFETSEAALEAVLEMIPKGSTVAYGGSITLTQVGLLKALRDGGYKVIDRPMNRDAYDEYYRSCVSADYFLMSSNAITYNGELVNIDGAGNRVAPLIHGPKNVIVVAGMNKLVPSLDAAMDRVKNVAAPPNCIRLHRNTPCAKFGRCTDCFSDDCICSSISITRHSHTPGRIKVVLIGEELGY